MEEGTETPKLVKLERLHTSSQILEEILSGESKPKVVGKKEEVEPQPSKKRRRSKSDDIEHTRTLAEKRRKDKVLKRLKSQLYTCMIRSLMFCSFASISHSLGEVTQRMTYFYLFEDWKLMSTRAKHDDIDFEKFGATYLLPDIPIQYIYYHIYSKVCLVDSIRVLS
jgi:hypothetical protein